MGKAIKKLKLVHEEKFSLGVLIHQQVRAAVEQALHSKVELQHHLSVCMTLSQPTR